MTKLLLVGLVVGQLCGDCDGDGQVLVAEVVRVVNNALAGPCACLGCPDTCREFPEHDGVQCDLSVCVGDEQRCVEAYRETSVCYPAATGSVP